MEKINKSGPRKLREAIANRNGRCLVGPGVFDGISTRVATSVGFDWIYMAGSGTTGSHLGEPDLSVMTQTEYAERARMIVMHTDRPVIADADTGFGGPVNIRRTIRLYEHAGVAGCHIEDQVFPKRCGQLNGKDVVDLQVFLERIRAAVEAKTDPDFMVIARTDARNADSFGGRDAGHEAFMEGVRRLKAALDAGADMAFMESPRSEEECKYLVEQCSPKPVMINVIPHGLTPAFTNDDCSRLGFTTVMWPCTGFIPAMLALQRSYSGLKNEGSDLKYCEDKHIQDFFKQCGLDDDFEFDKRIEKYSREKVQEKSNQKAG